MKKRIFAIITMCALLLTTSAIPAMSEEGAASTKQTLIKDETVYAALGYDGSVQNISVVNHIDTPADGVYTDTGIYDSIENLTGEEEASIADGKVAWTLPAYNEGFYYQGNLAAGNLPFNFTFSYELNGKEKKAGELAGKAGKVSITIKAEPNVNAAAYFKENFLCQIQLPLSLATCSNISAPGAQAVLTGKTLTLAYMVLPGKSASYTLTLDTVAFEADGMTISCSKFDVSGLLGTDAGGIGSGVIQLTGGIDRLISGTEQLKGGLSALSTGISSLANASDQLTKGTEDFKNGVLSYTAAAKTLTDSATAVNAGMSGLSVAGGELAANYSELSAGASTLIDAMLATMSPLEKAAFEKQVEQLKAGLSAYGEGLKTYTAGAKQTGQGMTQLTVGLKTFAQSGSNIAAGAIGLETGTQKLNSGMSAIAGISRVLPDQTQQLVDGQKQLLVGITSATAGLSNLLPGDSTSVKAVSFVSSDVSTRSVQFVIKTPAIKAEVAKAPGPEQKNKKKSFLQKFLDLFR